MNSDYGHDDGGNTQRTHAHDEQVSSQTTTYTKRDPYAKQTSPNSDADIKYYAGYDDTGKQSNVSTANNKWKPTTAARALLARADDAARSNTKVEPAERMYHADVEFKVFGQAADD